MDRRHRRRRASAHRTSRPTRAAGVVLALSALAAASFGASAATADGGVPAPAVDASCHNAAPADLAIFVLDLRKPLDPDRRAEPGRLLRRISAGLPTGSELRVYGIAPRTFSPLAPIARLCPPGDAAPESCGPDGGSWRCARLDAVQLALGSLVPQHGSPVDSAYLVEALERARNELAGVAGHRSLHVYSDMLQHARWYSHFDLAAEDWDSGRRAHAGSDSEPPAGRATATVEVFYVPRAGTTDAPAVRDVHQRLWRDRLAELGLDAVFRQLPPMGGYEVASFADRPTRLARLALERGDLDADRIAADAAADRLLAAQERLRDARTRVTAERRELDARSAELRARETAAREALAAEHTEIARLQAAVPAAEPREVQP